MSIPVPRPRPRPRPHPHPHDAGFSLIEVTTTLSVGVLLVALAGSLLFPSDRSMDTVVVDTRMDQEIKRGLLRLLGELKTSSASVISVAQSSPDGDVITLQTPGALSGAVTWGALDASGAWQLGWSVRYQVLKGSLVRQLFDGLGNRKGADELLVRQVAMSGDGLKGFRLAQDGPLLNASIRVWKSLGDGHTFQREYSSAIHLKNA